MKYIISYSLTIIIGIFFLFGCADMNEDLTAPPEVKVHGDEALNSGSDNFHAFLVKEDGIFSCQECHAADYSGGTAELSCASGNCHPSVGVHQEGINNPSGNNFHGLYVADNNSFFECQQCHGEEWSGGTVSPTCDNCHGGIAVHKEGIKNPTSENFHGSFIRGHDWDLSECSQCHGEDYAGGLGSPTCLTCHNDEGGPEACNTCHGDFSDPTQIAPPQGTNNETNTADYAVGAHQVHLSGIAIAQNVSCSECHTVPSEFESEGHIDGELRAELNFGDFTNSGPSDAGYNFTEFTCQNTYCHGNFEWLASDSQYDFAYEEDRMYGNNYSPIWNKVDGTQAVCGTCHGEIDASGQLVSALPNGHYGRDNFEIDDCANCHGSVVNQAGEIINAELHINGEKNVFDN